jgi:hypothetical protein
MIKPKHISAPCKRNRHDFVRTAVFYASEEQTCIKCGAKRVVKYEDLHI